MEIVELIGVLVLCLGALKAWVAIEAKKTESDKAIAQAQAEAAITKSKIWASSNERQEQIRANADIFAFSEPSASTSQTGDLDGIMSLIQSPQGQQLISTLLQPKKE